MQIGIINNAANYLNFNVNFGRFLTDTGMYPVFLNPDKYISYILNSNGLNTINYSKTSNIEKHYTPDSDLIRYFSRVFRIKNTKKLLELKNREYARAKQYLEKHPPDYVLILNGAFNVETEICKELGIKTFFFEHGYFPDCIQMDSSGVNCLTDFSGLSTNDFLKYHYPVKDYSFPENFEMLDIKTRIFTRILLRSLDPGYRSILREFALRKSNLKKAEKRFKKSEADSFNPETTGPYIFWPLQVNSDTQIILNSRYESMYDALEKVLPHLLKTGFKVVLKEHPMEVEPVDYSKFIDNQKVFLVKKYDLEKLIDNSEFVVNINSSVGLQSVDRGKKILILGKSFYSNAPSGIDYNPKNPSACIEKIIKLNQDKTIVSEYIDHFRKEIFISGHFYNPDPEFFKKITERLV